MKKMFPLSLLPSFCVLLFVAGLVTAQDVVTQRNDNARSGAYLNETTLTPANVNGATFGKIAQFQVNGSIFAQPLYLSKETLGGDTNVVYVATMANRVYAFDADDPTGKKQFWPQPANLGPPAELRSPCLGYRDYNDTFFEVGITGTPVISKANKALYAIALTQHPPPPTDTTKTITYTYTLHKLDMATGKALGKPNQFATSTCVNGRTRDNHTGPFPPSLQNQRPGLLHFKG